MHIKLITEVAMQKIDKSKHKVAYYHADMMPPPSTGGDIFPVKRSDGLAAAIKVETVEEAKARRKNGGPLPAHYIPVQKEYIKTTKNQDVSKPINPYLKKN